MKKIFLISLLSVMLFTLVGCGKENTIDNTDDLTTSSSDNQTIDSSDDYAGIELYSDDTKIVFKNGNTSLVYYYSGETITGYEAYIDYENAATANYALSLVTKDGDIKDAYTKGRYLVVVYDESSYEGTTTSDIRLLYSYLEEVKK